MVIISMPEKWIFSALEDWFQSHERIGCPEQIVRPEAAFAEDVQENYFNVLMGHQTYESFFLYIKNDLRVLSADAFAFLLPKIVSVAMQNPRSELMDYLIYILSGIDIGKDYYDDAFQILSARQINLLCVAIMMFGTIYCAADDFLLLKIGRACSVLLKYSVEILKKDVNCFD